MQSGRWIAVALITLFPFPASAHPHVFVNAKSELMFDASGSVTAVRHVWQFDEAFSSYAVQGLDTNGDGALTRSELAPLAQINMDSLAEYAFFTYLTVNGIPQSFGPPIDYYLIYGSGLLTLLFALPVLSPQPVADAVLDVFDPEYFVAYSYSDDQPVTMVQAPASCSLEFRPPPFLDPATAAALAAIPADQRALPPGLAGAAADLANTTVVTCRQ